MTVPQSLLVAAGAGAGNVVITNPIWLASTRMQAAAKQARRTTFVTELQDIYRDGGAPALWRVSSDHLLFG
jgi:Mitochondrial carrier protein